jgi:hypothetical protein
VEQKSLFSQYFFAGVEINNLKSHEKPFLP